MSSSCVGWAEYNEAHHIEQTTMGFLRQPVLVQNSISDGEWALIREALQRGQLTGTQRFVGEVEAIIGRRIENRKQGRPQKEADK